jgi:hypothetical protein
VEVSNKFQVADASVDKSVADVADASVDKSVTDVQDAELDAAQALLNNMSIPAPHVETLIPGTSPTSGALISGTSPTSVSASASFLKLSNGFHILGYICATALWIPDVICHPLSETPETDALLSTLLHMVPTYGPAQYTVSIEQVELSSRFQVLRNISETA